MEHIKFWITLMMLIYWVKTQGNLLSIHRSFITRCKESF